MPLLCSTEPEWSYERYVAPLGEMLGEVMKNEEWTIWKCLDAHSNVLVLSGVANCCVWVLHLAPELYWWDHLLEAPIGNKGRGTCFPSQVGDGPWWRDDGRIRKIISNSNCCMKWPALVRRVTCNHVYRNWLKNDHGVDSVSTHLAPSLLKE